MLSGYLVVKKDYTFHCCNILLPFVTTKLTFIEQMDWVMLQAVGSRFLIAEAWIPSQATSHGILWWAKWYRDGYNS
jgi:hypothetical protein